MEQEQVIAATENFVRQTLLGEGSGHDWHHIERVTTTAKKLAVKEGANLFVVTLAALLHDLADDKVVESEEEGLRIIRNWLLDHQVSDADQEHILAIITHMSFKGGNGKSLETIEGLVVQDADRLDAIGAVGIARCFTYAGKKGQPIYQPDLPVRDEMSVAEYRHGRSSAIHHFYEKLLKLKELMNTSSGYRMAEKRHQLMEMYLDAFFEEIGEQRR
ncbi:HD domain-containing protein [Gracilibacillus caseinilyticus]|uniref:HD domain-containing protein n=1 Tax=Gracilibacillus caseinilyticus TaxID=2932256 RepID=A0ABY4EXX6_9BACI|nr:HD domain-containing protein [Gracilibacillus caseinilyticus]UOQ48479.1 HD domain-containing protein [Gracilibacillus caseinilyticus]